MIKKLFCIASIMALETFASDIATLQTLYDNENYHEVIKQSQSNYEHYNTPQLHVLWAKSAQALGDDLSAMSAYERVLILDKDNTDAQVALVRLYKTLNRDSLSQELRASLNNQELSPSQRAALSVAYEDFSHKLTLKAKLSLGYDSNIGANSDLELSSDAFNEESETLFTRASAQITYLNYSDNSHWFWQIDGRFQAQNNFDADFYNLYDGFVGTGLGYKNSNISLYLPLIYGRMYYFERDFLQQYGTDPYINIVLSDTTLLNMNFKYLQRRFLDPLDTLRDDDIMGGNIALFYRFSHGFSYIRGGYDTYISNSDEPLYFTDKQIAYSDIGVSTDIRNYIFRGDYHFKYSSFDDNFQSKNSTEEKRNDTYHRVDLKMGRLFYNHWSVNLEYSYTYNDSNYEYASYNKQLVMTSLRYSY
ncbi:MAG: hypothetical protein U9N52_02500 [Campylobacterota bacterium]|nr:hypothetical protein [Campylobacterota bacterium]